MRGIQKYTLKMAQAQLPSRKKKDNKTTGGKCLVVAGSYGKWGAAILCAQAASRCGAGYTYVFDPAKEFPSVKNPDFLLCSKIKDFNMFDAIALGPGFDNHILLKKIIFQLARNNFPNVVLDAEALTVLAKIKKPNLPSTWILTPHEGELSRLLNIPSQTIRADRKKYVEMAQKKYGCLVVLKGFQTLIAAENKIWQISSGNPALAKAGTGDVLTGMIVGFLSQKVPAEKAACLAAYSHGHIADTWIENKNDVLSLLASDLVSYLPSTLSSIRSK